MIFFYLNKNRDPFNQREKNNFKIYRYFVRSKIFKYLGSGSIKVKHLILIHIKWHGSAPLDFMITCSANQVRKYYVDVLPSQKLRFESRHSAKYCTLSIKPVTEYGTLGTKRVASIIFLFFYIF